MVLSSLKLKKLNIFQEKLANPENQKFHIFYLLKGNFLNISAKQKGFLHYPL